MKNKVPKCAEFIYPFNLQLHSARLWPKQPTPMLQYWTEAVAVTVPSLDSNANPDMWEMGIRLYYVWAMELGLVPYPPALVSSLSLMNSRNEEIPYLISASYLWFVSGAECPELPTIDNGFVIDPSRQYFYGDEARVQCHRGFKLTGGSSIIKCGASQKFSNVPKCEGT